MDISLKIKGLFGALLACLLFVQPCKSQVPDIEDYVITQFGMEVRTNSSFPTSSELMAALPKKMELNQNYPNPFNPTTVIRYGVPQSSKVRLEVFDLLGRRVATLVNNEQQRAGWHQVNFDASRLASGIYLYRIVAGGYVETRKMLLIK